MKTLTLGLLLIITGCEAHWPDTGNRLQGSTADFNVPPKQLLQTVKQVVTSPPLSLGVESETKGVIVTTWQDFPGDWHVARRWQEHTRYRIAIVPDFDDPAGKSHIEVREQTQQRATSGQQWEKDEPSRPERAENLLKQIEQQINRG
jgi:hypothetical protein